MNNTLSKFTKKSLERFFYYSVGTLFAILGLIVLLNMYMTTPNPEESYHFLSPYDLRGMSVDFKGISYTLSFKQQNKVLSILNEAVEMTDVIHQDQKAQIDSVILYLFNDLPPLQLKIVAYEKDNIIFSYPDGYLLDKSAGELKLVLNEASLQ